MTSVRLWQIGEIWRPKCFLKVIEHFSNFDQTITLNIVYNEQLQGLICPRLFKYMPIYVFQQFRWCSITFEDAFRSADSLISFQLIIWHNFMIDYFMPDRICIVVYPCFVCASGSRNAQMSKMHWIDTIVQLLMWVTVWLVSGNAISGLLLFLKEYCFD